MDSAASAMEEQVANAKVDLEDIVGNPAGMLEDLPFDTGKDDSAASEDD